MVFKKKYPLKNIVNFFLWIISDCLFILLKVSKLLEAVGIFKELKKKKLFFLMVRIKV